MNTTLENILVPSLQVSSPMERGTQGAFVLTASWLFTAGLRHFLREETKLFDILAKLGLHEASWLDYLLDHGREVNLWTVALTSVERRDASRLSEFEAHPQARQSSGSAYEHPAADPMEMFFYSVLRRGYNRGFEIPMAARHAQGTLLRDAHGRTYYMDVADGTLSTFLIGAASRSPELLFGDDSPLYHIYDAFWYDKRERVAAVITQTPPWSLVRRLCPGIQRQDELRRILERARDLFSHLATLQKHGISLDGKSMRKDWSYALAYEPNHPSTSGPWLVPSYHKRSCGPDKEGKLARLGTYNEELPVAPLDAWPAAGAETSNLPWSHFSAYCDPRVPGPRMVSDEEINSRRASS